MMLATLIRRDSRVLDVGCGTGVVTELIQQETGCEVTGVEPDPDRVATAQGRGLHVVQGLLSREFFEQHGKFDQIVFADVLEHLANPAELVFLAKHGLNPGGAILLSVPNVAHWSVRANLLFGKFDYQDCGIMDATHLRWFTRAVLHTFLKEQGLKVTDHLYTLNTGLREYGLMAPWKWMSPRRRMALARMLLKRFPNLLGCQHIVRAVPE